MFQDVSKTWFHVQSEHEGYMLTVSEDTYEAEILWIDEPESKFHEVRSTKCQFENTLKEKTLSLKKRTLKEMIKELSKRRKI